MTTQFGSTNDLCKAIYNYRKEGKTFVSIAALVGYSMPYVNNLYHRYVNKNKLNVTSNKKKPSQAKMLVPDANYTEVETMVIEAEGLMCEVIREGENTYTVSTEYGTGVVLKKGLKLVGPLRQAHEIRYGRSYTGLFNSSKRGGKR